MTSSPLGQEYEQAGPLVRDLLLRILGPKPGLLAKIFGTRHKMRKQRICVILSPWYNCPVAYFMMILTAVLERQGSVEISFLIDDIAYPSPNAVFESEVAAIEEICAVYRGRCHIDWLSRLPPSNHRQDCDIVAETVRNALDYDIDHRIGYRFMPDPPPSDFAPLAEKQLVAKALRLVRFWKERPSDALFIPGGLVNGTWVYTDIARRFGLRCSSFDSSEGSLLFSTNGIASHQSDNAEVYGQILAAPADERAFAIANAKKIRATRELKGDDVITVKFDGSAVDFYDVALCMSFEADTAALGLDYIFKGARDWLESTVVALTKARPNIRIAIRQHPWERVMLAPQNVHALARVAELKAAGANVTVFDALSDVSTYELARRSKAVVVGASTFGVEAAMLGSTVIVFRHSYYAGTDFVLKPKDKADYIRLILEAIDGDHKSTNEQQDHAHLMYHVIESCNRIRAPFNPQPKELLAWIQRDPMATLESDTYRTIVDVIAGKTPFALRQHQLLWAAHKATVAPPPSF